MSNPLLRHFLSSIRQGRLGVVYADGSADVFGTKAENYPDVVIRFTDDAVPRDIVLDPRLGAAEAFMDARMVIEEGDVMSLVTLLGSNTPWERGGIFAAPTPARKIRNRVEWLFDRANTALTAQKKVAHHYDTGNDLYALMLDAEHWQYSCAFWNTEQFGEEMSLADAQRAKLAHIAAKLAIEPGDRILDIGCGWGGMAIYLARNYDVKVTGITLSSEQLDLARKRAEEAGLNDRIEFELIDYRDLAQRCRASHDQFDRIVSVGMFEHVGQPQFRKFFEASATMLAEDGTMLLHTIGRLGQSGTTDAFTRKYIFPGGYIPALSETLRASEKARLIATDIENLRLHYARTLRDWYNNCLANRDAIVALHDERFYRMWTFYLAGATTAFESGGLCNYQIQYARSRRALPLQRGYMEAEEKRLLAR